ncbi:MAG: glycosyltransferase family 2 protein [Oscillospiraceae bacterium]|nr:glycosyltransferase family 2 protein [Oscillospiraceae bacterium]
MKISGCWIVKNEAENIARSVESAREVLDEIIIVDTGSEDDTVAIAQSLGAQVLHFAWTGDFAAARNHSLSAATGDIIIALDADEWFEPRLEAGDRQKVTAMFAGNSNLGSVTVPLNNVGDDNQVVSTSVVQRMFRNKEDIRYQGRVHEQIVTEKYANIRIDEFPINHCGYRASVLPSKLVRNAAMLADEIKDAVPGSDDHVKKLFYLVRESGSLTDYDTAIEHLLEIFKYPGAVKRVCAASNIEFISAVYAAIQVAAVKRSRVSRRGVYQKLIRLLKEVYPDYAGSAEADLVYQVSFDLKEDVLLHAIEPAVAAANKMPDSTTHYKGAERELYNRAARAAWRRSDHPLMLEHVFSAFKDKRDYNLATLSILLGAIKGQPPQDIILFLNGLCDISDLKNLDMLIQATRIDGLMTVHSYYLKKHADSKETDDSAVLGLMLLHNKMDELVSVAAKKYAELQYSSDENAGKLMSYLSRMVFLAAICGAPPALIEPHSEIIVEYSHILDAFHTGDRLEQITQADGLLLLETYSIAAFAAGLDAGERYLNIFRANPALCYQVKGKYCEQSGLSEHLVSEDMAGIDPLDRPCHLLKIQTLIFAARHDEALREIGRFLAAGKLDEELFHMLLVVAEKSSGTTQAEAKKLYEQYIELFDTTIDLIDVVRTGVVLDEGGVKMKKALKSMTRAQFDKYLAEEGKRAVIATPPDLLRKAAEVYTQQDLFTEAARCLAWLVAGGKGTKDDCDNLANAFDKLGNKVLPAYLRTLAGIS